MTRKNFVMAAIITVVGIIAVYLGFNMFNSPEVTDSAVAIVTVDINPSFKLSIDDDDIVISVETMNDDAKEVNIEGIVGMEVEDAVELIIEKSEEAGYLNVEDLEDDFVLVTTIDMDDNNDEDKAEEVMERIKEKSEESEVLKVINLAMVEATLEQLENAERKNIPVGLYAVNGEGITSVKEFFADEGMAQQFLENGEMIENSFEHQLGLMATYMDELDLSEPVKESFQAAFEASKEDFFEAKRLYEEAKANYQEAIKSGDEDQIAEAEAILLRAKAFKDMMENYKDQVESVKEILKSAVEGEEDEEKLMERLAEEEQKRLEEKAKRIEEQQREKDKKAEEEQKRLEEQQKED